MVEDKKVESEEEVKPVEKETEQEEEKVEAPIEPEAKKPDPDIEAMKADMDKIKKEMPVIREKADKFDSVAQAVTGEKSPQDEEEKFREKMTIKGTKETIQELIDEETSDLKKQIADQKLNDADQQAFVKLRAQYPDFDGMLADANKYLTKEDYESTENMPNRAEIRFAIIASKRTTAIQNKKTSEADAMSKAKGVSNASNVVETPSAGGTPPDTETDLQKELAEAKKNHDHEKVAEILTHDMWNISGNKLIKQD